MRISENPSESTRFVEKAHNLIKHGGVDMDGVRVVKRMARLSEWKERIVDCRNSGQAVQVWCGQNRINPKTYYQWERLLMAEAVRITSECKNSVPGTLPGTTAGMLIAQKSQVQVPCIVKLDCAKTTERWECTFKLNGAEIIVPDDVCPAFLGKLLEAAGHAR